MHKSCETLVLVLIGVSAIINLDKSACGEQGGAFFFRQPTTGKMHYCLDIPRVWLVIGYARTCILHQLHSITIFYHHFRGRLTRNLIHPRPKAGCALHAHWLILGPYLANSTNLGHLSPLFEAMGQIIVGMDRSWHLSMGIILTNPQHTQLYGILRYTLCRFWYKQRCLHDSLLLEPNKTTPETIKRHANLSGLQWLMGHNPSTLLFTPT